MNLFTDIFLRHIRSRNTVRFGADRISILIDPDNDLRGRLGLRGVIKRTKTTSGTYWSINDRPMRHELTRLSLTLSLGMNTAC